MHDDEKRYHVSMHKELADTRVYTLEQAIAHLSSFKGGFSTALSQIRGKDASFKAPKCAKCEKAGLPPRACRHRTTDCVDRVRHKQVQKLKDERSKKRKRDSNRGSENPKKTSKVAHHKNRKNVQVSTEECPDSKWLIDLLGTPPKLATMRLEDLGIRNPERF